MNPPRFAGGAASGISAASADLERSPLVWFRGCVDDPGRSAEKFSVDGRLYVMGDLGRVAR